MQNEKSFTDNRTRLIDATIRLLATCGPSEVKARPVASEAGLSTIGVYNHFGSIQGLLQAVADEGFKRQSAVFKQVTNTDDPMTDLCLMAIACHDFAQRNPHLYDLMFGLSILGRYSPTRGDPVPKLNEFSPAFKVSYSYLLSGCTRLVEDHCIFTKNPDLVAVQFWSTLHGFIMLDLGGHFANYESPTAEILLPMCINLVVGLGAKREQAEYSATNAVSKWMENHP